MAERLVIRYAELNSRAVSKRVKAGTTVADFAEKLEVSPSEILVNAKKVAKTYKFKNEDFVCVVTNVGGGKA